MTITTIHQFTGKTMSSAIKPSKRARKKARARTRSTATGAARAALKASDGSASKPTRKAPQYAADTGLAWLKAKQRISGVQARAGEIYGGLYRTDIMGGAEPLRSCLDDSLGGGGAGAGLPPNCKPTAEWITESRAKLLAARAALNFHAAMIAACDVVCGRGVRPREITTSHQEGEEIVTTLRIALDLLVTHFNVRKGAQRQAA